MGGARGGCATLSRLLRSLATGVPLWPHETAFHSAPEEPAFKVLLVVAHPDDESECAAVLYRITHELGGAVDQIVVTNGEAGAQYSAPAQAYYGLSLSEEATGRRHLVRLRRKEVLRAGQILGIRHNYFFGQKDTGFTLDPLEGFHAWNVGLIQQQLFTLLERERYDLVLVLLPSPGTHGHHQTVAQITLEAVANLEPQDRPAVLGARTVMSETGLPESFSELDGFPLTRTTSTEPAWTFDRRTPLKCHNALDYSIVVNWVIAEHKSQGIFQMEYSRRTQEHFWLFEVSGPSGAARWCDFLQKVEGRQQSWVVREEEFAKALSA
jgi:LmbE family N-acetylglucosaminyl deacetylase